MNSPGRPGDCESKAGARPGPGEHVGRIAVRLLERLGVPFRCQAPSCDESSAEKGRIAIRTRLAEGLAHAKAASLAGPEPRPRRSSAATSSFSFEGQVFGKPGTTSGAIEQLARLWPARSTN